MELYKKYRPRRFADVVGQQDAVRVLRKLVHNQKVPHAILFSGESGCGKTTLARILAAKIGCGKHDLIEINSSDFRGIDTVRDIRSRMTLKPISGKSRVWILDELHQMRADAQNALLKILEDTPDHCYFMLATTEPGRLLRTIRTRCTDIKVRALDPRTMESLLQNVLKRERLKLDEQVVSRIIDVADGSARKALVVLHQVSDIEGMDKQMDAVLEVDLERQAIEIARALINPNTSWKEMSKILKDIKEEPESIRRSVLGYSANVMLSGGPLTPRAFAIVDYFSGHFYDSGRAGLIGSCYAVINAGKRR